MSSQPSASQIRKEKKCDHFESKKKAGILVNYYIMIQKQNKVKERWIHFIFFSKIRHVKNWPTLPSLNFSLINYFNWRLITILWWFLPYIDMNQCTCVSPPPPSPSHPSGLSQWMGFECPVSCIKLGLVIRFTYGNIHVSMLFSQIIPSSPSPRVQKSVLYIYVFFAVSHIGPSLPSF